MTIRPKNVLKFQTGGSFNLDTWIKENPEYYKWYSSIYPNAPILQGNPLKQRNDNWNRNQLSSSHYTTDDLQRSAYNNYLYTNDYDARQADIQHWADEQKDISNLSDEEVVKRYNDLAQLVRTAREAPQTYNRTGYTDSNRAFRSLFYNRSKQGTNVPLYTIGYQPNIEDIEGTSTWQRRMDRYQKKFNEDTPEGQKNRIFYITRPDGTKIKVYKKDNGDIGLFNEDSVEQVTGSFIPGKHTFKNGNFDWNKLREGLQKIAPNILAAGRLAYALDTNKRMLDEQLAANKPQLQGSYHTYHQVTGDEGSKQAYYRRAAQGQTSASRPFTSNADRQMAYQMEARRIGDEARAQGDLIDNQEIRRTSELSKQHSDANIARDNQVANANYLSLLQSQAQKHLLKNNYLAANHSSWNNYLLGLETRMNQKQAERQALEDQIYALDAQNRLLNDKDYQGLYDRMNEAYNSALSKNTDSNGNIDYIAVRNDPEFKQAQLEFQNKQYQLQRRQYSDMLSRRSFAKDGMKISYKKKDDLLYKTARDTVEHFRKMVKMSDDSMQKSFKKPLKLIKPPKSTTRKMQTGGVAPFVVYTPTPLGGETTTSTSSDGVSLRKGASSTKKDKDSTLDTIKDLFKNLEGLPSDVNHVYQSMQGFLERSKAFGTEINSDDLASIFLQQMHQINNIKFSKRQYDSALKQATDMDALDEFAVTSDGRFVVQDSQKDLTLKSWEEIKKSGKYTPLTNNDLLNIRAYDQSGKYILGKGDASLLTIVNSGIGMSKIADFIKEHIPDMGTSEETIEGYTKKQSQQIQEGFKQLLQDAPDGDYHWSKKTEDQKEQIEMAFAYINSILPENMKAVLKAHADINRTTPDNMLRTLLGAKRKTINDLKLTAVTGKDDDFNKVNSNPLLAMQREIGGTYQNYSITTRDSNTKLSVNGTFYSALPKVSEDVSIDKMLNVSGIAGIIQGKRGITLGDQEVSPEDLKHIMYANNGGMVVSLPCKIVNGIKQVNLDVLNKYEQAEQKALQVNSDRQSQQFINALAKELKNEHLDSLLDSRGLPNKNMFGQFLVVEAYTTDKIKIDPKSKYLEKVENPDEQLEQRMIKALSTDQKKPDYSIDVKDHWTLFEGTWDDIYRGTVFIPLNNNPNSAINSWGGDVKINQSTELEELYQISNKSSNFNRNNTLE